MSLRKQTLSGVLWSALTRTGQQGLYLVTSLILARLLPPSAFGVLGMVTALTGFLAIFRDLGLSSAIVQDQSIDSKQLSGIFWLSTGFSVLLGLLTAVSAPFLARFYGEPSLVRITTVLAITFPVDALGTVPSTLLRKEMAFKKLALARNMSMLAGSVVGICMALMGLGVWALVWQQVVSSLSRTVLFSVLAHWDLQWIVPVDRIRDHLRFGVTLQVGTLLNYGARNVDDILIGRSLGADVLGNYQMAYRLMLWPLEAVSRVVGQVMFPALATIQNDTERVKRAFLRTIRSIALVTFPMVLGLWVVAPSAIGLVLGERWTGAIPIFRVLCLLGLIQSIVTNIGWVFSSQGRPDINLRLVAFSSTLFVASFAIGIRWGAIGVAACYATANLIAMPIQLQVAGQLIGTTFLEIANTLKRILLCALVMSTAVALIGFALPSHWPVWVCLMVQVSSGVLVYAAMVHVFRVEAYLDLREILTEQWPQLKRHRLAEILRLLQ